ncbi:protein MEI2-like 6 [Aegilops tauschii subsp. strangulata]|uniref:Mei2-like C-terminal RNA recognition motif domain-containing protein n=1 Tax=Aegilops tauschii TaxID=37682 RepID=R7WCW1_AEGTA|nr:protein MEI2-like 6 [Aegilops tauschii subsp. strangulata]XP_044401692.1 protein MEI2-like 6 [Triticum aestivum]
MAAYSTSLLHPAAPGTGPVAFFPAELCSAAPFVLPLCCPFLPQYLYPPPPLPPSCGLVVGCDGWLAPMGSAYTVGVPALPFLPWLHMPPPPPFPMALYYNPALKPPLPATRCSITEIVEDGDVEPPTAEVEDGPSPRSVLAVWRRSAALPPPSSGVAGSKPAFDGRSKKTSVMICNIPNSFLKRRLMAILDQHCAEENKLRCRPRGGGGAVAKSEYDFLYLPIDFRTKCNKGYAFVNMTTPAATRRLYAFLHGHRWAGSAKVCEVVHAHIQGVDALAAHFSRSLFPCGNNKEFLPVRFGPPRDGLRQTAERTIGCAVVRRRLR